jgi:hypothetical protein
MRQQAAKIKANLSISRIREKKTMKRKATKSICPGHTKI